MMDRRLAKMFEPPKWYGAVAVDPDVLAALRDVVDELREHGHYETCDWVLRFDASCSCPMAALDRLDALTSEKEQTE
jgi:hypothetical protein